MLQIKPLDPRVPIFQQLNTDVSPVVLVNVFQVAEADIPALLKAWEADANWMKQQPGYISTQLHQGIAGSTVFMNYAVWESVAHFRAAFGHLHNSRRPLSTTRLQLWHRPIFSRDSRFRICVLVHRPFEQERGIPTFSGEDYENVHGCGRALS